MQNFNYIFIYKRGCNLAHTITIVCIKSYDFNTVFYNVVTDKTYGATRQIDILTIFL